MCHARGLTGSQGVIIPKSNVSNLMLSDEVCQAVEKGEFAIYAIATADEALHLLTGIEPGKADAEGNYPENSINFRVIEKLEELSKLHDDEDEEEETEKDKKDK